MGNTNNYNKETIINLTEKKYNSVVNYVTGLTPEEFIFCYQHKWTAGQQVLHLTLSLKPLVKILSTGRLNIQQTFGLAAKQGSSYNIIVENVDEQLRQGGKAPDRFLPEPVSFEQKNEVCNELIKVMQELNEAIKTFTENDLDLLMLPHPLLGKITMREMLYVMIFHAEHHEQLTRTYLSNK